MYSVNERIVAVTFVPDMKTFSSNNVNSMAEKMDILILSL